MNQFKDIKAWKVNYIMYNGNQCRELANKIRKLCLEMALDSGKSGSHIGGSLSCVEIFAVLYGKVLNYDIKNPTSEDRDRLIVSKAHCVLSNFAALHAAGFFEKEDLFSFHKNGGLLAGHPYNPNIGLEFCGGSLGMGISAAVGMALVARQGGQNHKVYTLVGDGELDEGSVWESIMTASKYKLSNLTIIVDCNKLQFDGPNENIMPLESLENKFSSFGMGVIRVNGHDVEELYKAFEKTFEEKPKVILADTIKCRGVERLENKAESHHASISEEDYELALKWMEDGDND
jgi:transketolase